MTDITFKPLEKMIIGLDVACNAAKATAGPLGRNVYIDDAIQPKISNDWLNCSNKLSLTAEIQAIKKIK